MIAFGRVKPYLFSISYVVILILSFLTNWHIALVLSLMITLIIQILDKLGKGIVLREMVALFSNFITVAMPLLGYLVYNIHNSQARLWKRYMPVPEDVYFGYALPAGILFTLAITWPFASSVTDEGAGLRNLLKRARQQLQANPKAGMYLIVVGLIMFAINGFLPGPLRFVGTLFYFSAFAGVLYIYFTPKFPRKKLLLSLFGAFVVGNAIVGGMFTLVAYMGMTLFSFFFIGRKTSFFKKVLAFFAGAFLLILIQSVKHTYRQFIWTQPYEGSKALLFTNLMVDRVSNLRELFTPDAFFIVYYRSNQGYNVSMVMRRFPRVVPHDNGARLSLSLAAALVPRLFWPDKPEAGGRANMKYYTGMTIRRWSTNVGPLGEAYAAFGVTGGIVFMFLLGLFLRFFYRRVFVIGKKMPLLIFWIPVLFYQTTYSAESDTLQILNSLFKSALFIWMLSRVKPEWFGIVKKNFLRRAAFRPVNKPETVINEPGI